MKYTLSVFALVLALMASFTVKGDSLYVAAGDVYRFDTVVGAASRAHFCALTNVSVRAVTVDPAGNVYAGCAPFLGAGYAVQFTPNGTSQFRYPQTFSVTSLAWNTNGFLVLDGLTNSSSGVTPVIAALQPNETTVYVRGGDLMLGGLAYDSSGTLWSANGLAGNIKRILSGGGSTNVITLPNAGNGSDAVSIAFDAAGNLYVVDANDYYAENSGGIIYEFTNNAGTISTNVNIFATGGHPYAAVFDRGGNFFVADKAAGTIYEYPIVGGRLSTIPTTFATGLSIPVALAVGPAEPPNLSISTSGTGVTVSWLSTSTNLVLQSTASLSAPSWVNVLGTVTKNGITNSLAVSSPGSLGGFRLSQD